MPQNRRLNRSRPDFRAKVIGKTFTEVKTAFGKPYTTHDHGENVTWVYPRVSVDLVAERLDAAAWVEFKDGVVTDVIWSAN